MTCPFEDFRALEVQGWRRVAAQYENAWSGLTRLFIPALLDAAAVTSGLQVLDVACGPGYVAEAAGVRGAKPIGIDFSPEMIAIARQRNSQIPFRQGDAQRLEFADQCFDIVLMNFGLLHLPQPETAIAEAHRVLRPGGRFGFTAWAGPEQSAGARIVEEALRAHADMSVAVPKGPAGFEYANPEACGQTLQKAGFDSNSLVFRTVTATWRVPSASFLFEAERDAGVRTAALLAAQTPQALSAIASQMEDAVRPFADGTTFAIPYSAHVIAVTRR